MITMAWVRLFRAEDPSTPQRYVDHRGTARVIVPGPVAWPCHGPDCQVDTGSEFVHWCGDKCLLGWHHQQLNTPATTGATA